MEQIVGDLGGRLGYGVVQHNAKRGNTAESINARQTAARESFGLNCLQRKLESGIYPINSQEPRHFKNKVAPRKATLSVSENNLRIQGQVKLLDGNERRHVDIVLSYLAVKPRAVNSQQIRRRLLVAASALQRSFDYQPFNIFQRHIGRDIPSRTG